MWPKCLCSCLYGIISCTSLLSREDTERHRMRDAVHFIANHGESKGMRADGFFFFVVAKSLKSVTYLVQTLVFSVRQWVGICQGTWVLQAALSCECCDSSRLRFAPLSAPPCHGPIHDPNTNKLAFSQAKRLWIHIWCKNRLFSRAGTIQMHLIISFITVWECKMAYVRITCAHRSETDLYFQLWHNECYAKLFFFFSAHMHRDSKVCTCAHAVLKTPDHGFWRAD